MLDIGKLGWVGGSLVDMGTQFMLDFSHEIAFPVALNVR